MPAKFIWHTYFIIIVEKRKKSKLRRNGNYEKDGANDTFDDFRNFDNNIF
jgi:hypothetical protein